jgi:hypothetical protein
MNRTDLSDYLPASLPELEKMLAWAVLEFISHHASRPQSQHASNVLSALRQELEGHLRQSGVTAPFDALARSLDELQTSALKTSQGRLVRILGEIVEKFNASSGWVMLTSRDIVFDGAKPPVVPSGSEFYPVAAYNAPEQRIRRQISESQGGVVGRVFHTGVPAVVPNVNECQYYIADTKATKSEIAVPIVHGKLLIGVLNLESSQLNAFTPADLLSLLSASLRLTVDLLVTRSTHVGSGPVPWHPFAQGWTFPPVINQLCDSISRSLPTQLGNPAIGCASWYHDRSKKVLYVRGASRFDFEYFADHELPENSHIGRAVLALVRQSSSGGTPKRENHEEEEPRFDRFTAIDEADGFVRCEKARRMQLSSIAVFPFHEQNRSSGDQSVKELASALGAVAPSTREVEIAGALVLYDFRVMQGITTVSLPHLFERATGLRLAERVGTTISRIHSLRRECGVAYLIRRLAEDATSVRSPFETIKAVFVEIFDAPGCSIFVKDPHRETEQLVLLATTGVRSRYQTSEAGAIVYPIAESDDDEFKYNTNESDDREVTVYRGMTKYLALNPNCVIRKLDVVDLVEPVEVQQGMVRYFAPRSVLIEAFAPGAGEHMRFLGISISVTRNDGLPDNIGVVRLTRPGTSNPFTAVDEDLLRCLCLEVDKFFREAVDDLVNDRRVNDGYGVDSLFGPELDKFKKEVDDYRGFIRTVGAQLGSDFLPGFYRSVMSVSRCVGELQSKLSGSSSSEAFVALPAAPTDNKLLQVMGLLLQKEKADRSADGSEDTLLQLLVEGGKSFPHWDRISARLPASRIRRRLLSRPSTLFSPSEAFLRAVLEDLNQLIDLQLKRDDSKLQHCVVMSSLRLVLEERQGGRSGQQYMVLHPIVVQPVWTKKPPVSDRGEAIARRFVKDRYIEPVHGEIAWGEQKPVVFSFKGPPDFDRFHPMHEASRNVRSGCCYPFRVPCKITEGSVDPAMSLDFLLSLDLAESIGEDKIAMTAMERIVLPSVALAARKLAWCVRLILCFEFGGMKVCVERGKTGDDDRQDSFKEWSLVAYRPVLIDDKRFGLSEERSVYLVEKEATKEESRGELVVR